MSEAEQRIAEIAARAEKATAGPWIQRIATGTGDHHLIGGAPGNLKLIAKMPCGAGLPPAEIAQNFANRSLITNARADIPWLLEQLKQARAALALGPGGAHE